MDDEQVEGNRGNRRIDQDLDGMEPVRDLASVEHQLQGADADAEAPEAEEVEQLALRRPPVVDEDEDAERGDDPDRQVDVEHPAPAVILGQPAAERRPHDRAGGYPAAQTAIAWPCRSGGLIWTSTDCDNGTNAAPQIPCSTR